MRKTKMETEKQKGLEPVKVETGPIELPTIDVTPYVGKKAKITDATTMQGGYGYCVRVQTEVVETIGDGEKKVELRGSRIFGLQMDEDGNVGWGADTKLGHFLAKMKAKTLKELVGKEVTLQIQTSKTGTDFLSFA